MDPYSAIRRSYDTEMLIWRTLFALDPNTGLPISTNYILTTDGIGGIDWNDPLLFLSSVGTGIGYLPSTLNSLTSNLSSVSSMVSSLQIGLSTLSTTIGNAFFNTGIYIDDLTSTVRGIGTEGYVSTLSLQSTVQGLGTVGYVSTLSLVSTTSWLIDPSRYVSTGALVSTTNAFINVPFLQSTVQGLGTAGYVSTLSLTSSLISTTNAISSFYSTFTSSLYSTVQGRFVSTSQLFSTVEGLGSAGYVSTLSLVSTTSWFLDPSRYVSTGALISTTNGLSSLLQTAFYVDRAGTIVINGGTVVISSTQSVTNLSSFIFSSMVYKGTNGANTGLVYPNPATGSNMIFSTAVLPFDAFSSMILSNSKVTLDIYPYFAFSPLNTGATTYLTFPMSTFLRYGTQDQLNHVADSWVFGNDKNFGTMFQQPIKLQVPGSVIANKYASNYFLCHNMPGAVTFNLTDGLKSNLVDIRMASTNSLFLTLQNVV
jgi:hypothetical protein